MIKTLETLLKQKKLRVTPIRLEVLAVLDRARYPIGIQELARAVKGADLVSVYRTMETFVKTELVHKHHVGHEHEDYELAARPHHHHIACQSCGKIEDIAICLDPYTLESRALSEARSFHSIKTHEITFHGICKTCNKQKK